MLEGYEAFAVDFAENNVPCTLLAPPCAENNAPSSVEAGYFTNSNACRTPSIAFF